MKVLRKQEQDVIDIQIGDQITIPLVELGEFTATAHKVTDDGVLFVFDQYVTKRPMYKNDSNISGFEKSDLKKWMDTVLRELFPNYLEGRITGLSICSIGEMFERDDEGWDDEQFVLDTDEQLPLMNDRKNRIAFFNNDSEWCWLKNAVEQEIPEVSFAACVTDCGDAGYGSASSSFGVRPVFWLVG